MASYQFTISTQTAAGMVAGATLEKQIVDSGLIGFVDLTTDEDLLTINFSSSLSPEDEAILTSVVAGHAGMTTSEALALYLDTEVFPFVKEIINTFAAENIAMGITQAGKTADVLGLFQKAYNIGASHPCSLKASFDTGSLYVSLTVLQYVRDNPAEYTGLGPFVTDARLLELKNKIETFLGVPLST